MLQDGRGRVILSSKFRKELPRRHQIRACKAPLLRTAAGARIRTQYTTLSQIPNPMGPLTERARVRRTYAHKSKVTYRQGCRQEKNKVDFHKRRSHEGLDKKCLCVLREGKRDLDQDLDVTSGILTGKLSSFRCPPVQNWTPDCVPRKNFR